MATYERRPAGGESIREEHLPLARSEYRHRSRIYWEERAEKLGADFS